MAEEEVSIMQFAYCIMGNMNMVKGGQSRNFYSFLSLIAFQT
jgi:hypothetical protein